MDLGTLPTGIPKEPEGRGVSALGQRHARLGLEPYLRARPNQGRLQETGARLLPGCARPIELTSTFG